LKNFSQISVKTTLCGVAGSERIFKRVWDTSQQAKSVRQAIGADRRIYGKGLVEKVGITFLGVWFSPNKYLAGNTS